MTTTFHATLFVRDENALFIETPSHSQPLWLQESDPDLLLDWLATHRGDTIRLCLDTSDQRYQIESFPLLARTDRHRLIRQRLARNAPSDTYNGFNGLTKESALLFWTTPGGTAERWTQRLSSHGIHFEGLSLWPMEVPILLRSLAPEALSGWCLAILAGADSRYRQIVLKDGKVVFSRLTPRKGHQKPEAFLADDLSLTRAYLERIGFSASAPHHLVAFLEGDLAQRLRPSLPPTIRYLSFSPETLTKRLGLPSFLKEESTIFETLWAHWLGRQTKTQTSLLKPDETLLKRKRRIRFFQSYGVILLLAASATFFASEAIRLASAKTRLHSLSSEIDELESEWSKTQQALAPHDESLGRLREAIERKRFYAPADQPFLALIDRVAQGWNPLLKITHLSWSPEKLDLQIEIPVNTAQTMPPDNLAAFVDQAAAQIQKSVSGYTVRILRYPFPNLPDETLTNKPKIKGPVSATLTLERIEP